MAKGIRIRLTDRGVIEELSNNPQLRIEFPGYAPVVRMDQLASSSVTTQAIWHINGSTGSDSNDGTTAATALQTFTELIRRMGPNPILQQNTTIALDSITLKANDRVVLSQWQGVTAGTTLTISGTVTAGANLGTVTSATLITHGVADGAQRLNISGLTWPAAHTRVRIFGGARDGAIAYVNNPAIAANTAQLSPFTTTAGVLPTKVTPQIGDTLIAETVTQVQAPLVLTNNSIKLIVNDVEFLDDSASSGQAIQHQVGLLPRFARCYFHGAVRVTSPASVLFNACQFNTAGDGVFSNGPGVSDILACYVDGFVEGFWQVDYDTLIDATVAAAAGVNSNYGYLTFLGDVGIYNLGASNAAVYAQVGARITNKPIFNSSYVYGTGNGYVFQVTGGSQVWIKDTTKICITGSVAYALFENASRAGPTVALSTSGNAIYQLDAGT